MTVSTMIVHRGEEETVGGRGEHWINTSLRRRRRRSRRERERGGVGEERVEVLDSLLVLVEVLEIDPPGAVEDRERRRGRDRTQHSSLTR
jgi:hypothetical protein